MIIVVGVLALIAAPLAPSEALELLTLAPGQPPLEKLDARCKKSVETILRAPLTVVRDAATPISIRCAKPRFPKLAAAIDLQGGRCRSSEEACAAWLVHARAALVDVLGPADSTGDFGQVVTAIAALGIGDEVNTPSANRAVEAANRLSAAKADNPAAQRLALTAWLSLPATLGSDGAFAKLIPRVLATNAEDPEVWGAFVFMAQRTNAVDATRQFLDAVAETSTNATHRARAHYLLGCLAMHTRDAEGARAAFAAAAKADPFDGTYRKALEDAAAGARFQCRVVMTPFGTTLKEALQSR